MPEIQPHAPLDRTAQSWLIHLADPGRRAPVPSRELDPRQLPRLFDAAELHGVLPSVLRRLSKKAKTQSGSSQWSAGDAAAVENARLKLAYQTGFGMMLTHHANRVMEAFKAASIGAAVIKGLTFARTLYPEVSLRTFTDVDVLLSERQRTEVADVMRALGFQLFEFEDRKGKDYHEQKWALPSQQDIMVEVHSNLVHSPKLRAAMSLRYEDVIEAGQGDRTACSTSST